MVSMIAGGTHAARPNIIVIMADDLGYGDVSCYGAKTFETPNIDRLAAGGLRFTDGYCTASTCTPTRYSFLTGTYAFRQKKRGVAGSNDSAWIMPGTETIASLLKKAGYRTAVIGKWHLGLGDDPKNGPDWNGDIKPGPREIGFDYSFILPTTNDRVPNVYVRNHRVVNLDPKDPLWVGSFTKPPHEPDHPTGKTHRHTLRMDYTKKHSLTIHNGISRLGYYTGGHSARWRDEDLGLKWVEESVKWIEENKNQPFFLFFASHDIHTPRMPHERFQGKTIHGYRGDAIIQLDWGVGEIMKTLDRLELTENTLVVFCSDNGPVVTDGYKDGAAQLLKGHRPAGLYSGGKYTILEGGTRTPFITYWKGHIQPGVSDKMVSTVDLPASMAALVGVELPDTACPDSLDVLDALMGEADAEGRDHVVQQVTSTKGFALRAGNWKIMCGQSKKGPKGKLNGKPVVCRLYDLSMGKMEKQEVSAKNPKVVSRLLAQLNEIVTGGRSRP